MAIAFGAALGLAQGSGTSKSLTSLSISGSNVLILASVRTETVSKTVSSLYLDDGSGGSQQAFTQIGTYKDAESGNHRISLWYLIAPNLSNTRIIATISASDQMYLAAVYYTGVAQSSVLTTPSQGGPLNYSSQSQADTSDTDGSYHVGVAISGNAGLSFSAGTARQATSGAGNDGKLVDSNAGVNNGSSNTFTWSGGTSTAWIMAMMRPSVAVAPKSNFFLCL